jgi:hypothetical protein
MVSSLAEQAARFHSEAETHQHLLHTKAVIYPTENVRMSHPDIFNLRELQIWLLSAAGKKFVQMRTKRTSKNNLFN